MIPLNSGARIAQSESNNRTKWNFKKMIRDNQKLERNGSEE